MKIKIARGYVYTHQAFDYLKEIGFEFVIEEDRDHGCRRALELCEVFDEDLFVTKNFTPEMVRNHRVRLIPEIIEREIPEKLEFRAHPNGVSQFIDFVEYSKMPGKPWLDSPGARLFRSSRDDTGVISIRSSDLRIVGFLDSAGQGLHQGFGPRWPFIKDLLKGPDRNFNQFAIAQSADMG